MSRKANGIFEGNNREQVAVAVANLKSLTVDDFAVANLVSEQMPGRLQCFDTCCVEVRKLAAIGILDDSVAADDMKIEFRHDGTRLHAIVWEPRRSAD